MSITEKLTTIAENEPKVYDAGKRAQYDEFWDNYQDNGNRTQYNYAFAGYGWTDETFAPKYDMKMEKAERVFANAKITSVKALLEKYRVTIDFSECTGLANMFAGSTITEMGVIDTTSASSLNNVFYMGTKITTIDKLILKSDGSQTLNNTTFQSMNALQNIIFEGVIGKNGFNVQWSTNLSHDSLISTLNCLADKSTDTSGTEWAITIGDENYAKLTTEERNIAYNKGWVIY